MDLKFVNILNRFLPKGKFWEDQPDIIKLLNGTSDEFKRAYDDSKYFYENFNIISSSKLAVQHSLDYLITQDLYSRAELQRIIVEYLNKDYGLKDAIIDFTDFIGTPIEFGTIPNPFIVGRSTAGNILGDPAYDNTRAILYIKFLDVNDVNNIRKTKDLVEYLVPPYLKIVYNTTNDVQNKLFIVGSNTAGNPLGQILV